MKLSFVLLALLAAVCCLNAPALGNVWYAFEPDLGDSAYPSDSSPQSHRWPSEIFSMSIDDLGSFSDGTFTVKIETNFGDLTTRNSYDGIYGNVWRDSYTSGVGMRSIAAGDLYIRVIDKDTNATTALYGLVLEGRQGSGVGSTDPWKTTLTGAGYTYSAMAAGTLWQVNGNDFATGTYEEYAAHFNEKPDMALAKALPGLSLTANAKDNYTTSNYYPTIALGNNGQAVGTGTVGWAITPGRAVGDSDAIAKVTPLGEWTATFALPTIAANEAVDVWWAMECGNDGVRVTTPAGAEVPTPSSLLLCGIGIAFAAVGKRFRRRK